MLAGVYLALMRDTCVCTTVATSSGSSGDNARGTQAGLPGSGGGRGHSSSTAACSSTTAVQSSTQLVEIGDLMKLGKSLAGECKLVIAARALLCTANYLPGEQNVATGLALPAALS